MQEVLLHLLFPSLLYEGSLSLESAHLGRREVLEELAMLFHQQAQDSWGQGGVTQVLLQLSNTTNLARPLVHQLLPLGLELLSFELRFGYTEQVPGLVEVGPRQMHVEAEARVILLHCGRGSVCLFDIQRGPGGAKPSHSRARSWSTAASPVAKADGWWGLQE